LDIHPSLTVKFQNNFTQVNNSEFVSGTALIAYTDENRNNSDIPEQAFIDAMPSLGLVPIVGHWMPEKQNFGGHDITIEFSGNQLILKDNTVPYGVVKENHNAEWIEIEENGIKKKYLKADVVLWYGRYPEPVQKVIDTGINQSMEVNPLDYEENKNGKLKINKFEYSALCLLGREIDENGVKGKSNVEPCFPNASVIVDKFGLNDNFKSQFNNLLFELNNQINTTSTQGGDTGEMNILKEDKNLDNTILSFSATYRQKREALANALDPIIVKDDNGETIEETYYYVEDFDNDFVYVEKYFWNQTNSDCTYGRYGYSFDETGLIATITGEFEKMILTWLTEQENQDIQSARDVAEEVSIEYEALKIGVEDYKNNVSGLESEKEILSTKVSEFEASIKLKDSEIVTLQTYHDAKELEIKQFNIDEIISEFEEVLAENEEFKLIKEKCMTYEIEDLKKELFILEGKLKHIKSTKVTKKVQNFSSKVSVVEPEGNEMESYYGNAVKYLKK